ncbi:MAG: M12 family metallopeptidase [bacterium]|nr:M12 family metallopeptidase [bacterium]
MRPAILALALAGPLAAAPAGSAPAPEPDAPYEVVDGMALQGDIILGPVPTAGPAALRPRAASTQAWRPDHLWPAGVVPYTLDETLPGEAIERIRAAIEEWNGKTVITLVERAQEADYVKFATGPRCAAHRGRRGGEQQVWLNSTCSTPAIVHEIGHAIGLAHEHQRTDRALWLHAHYETTSPRWRRWLAPAARPQGPYDYRSAMHYRTDSTVRMETVPPGIEVPSDLLSEGDIDGVARLYGQTPTATTVATNPPGLTVLVDGIATQAPAAFDWPPGSRHTIEVLPEPQVVHGSRFLFARWNDDAPRSREVTAGEDWTWLEANFIVQRRITARPSRPEHGAAATTPPRPGGWHLLRSQLEIEATPARGRQFLQWNRWGEHGLASNPARITVSRYTQPVTAYFTTSALLRIEADVPVFELLLDGQRHFAPSALRLARHPQGATIRIAETQAVRGQPGSRYRFAGWSDGAEEAERQIAPPLPATTIKPLLQLEHQLANLTSGNTLSGEVLPDRPSADGYYADGTRVTVRAQPAGEHEFARWTAWSDVAPLDSQNPEVTLSMDRPRLAEAQFTRTRLLHLGEAAQPGETSSRALRFAVPPGAKAVEIAFDAPGSLATLEVLRLAPEGRPPRSWEVLHRRRHRLSADDAPTHRSEIPGPAGSVVLSATSDPPLDRDPRTLYFVRLVHEGTDPQPAAFSLQATGSGPVPPLGLAQPAAFTFVAAVGSDPQPQTVTLTNHGGEALHFAAASAAAWLRAEPAQGSILPGEAVELQVLVTALVPPDTHVAALEIRQSGSASGDLDPLSLPVWFAAYTATE